MANAALFADKAVHERELTLGDGAKHMLWFKKIPSSEFRKLRNGKDDETTDKVIAASLCEPDGSVSITVAQVGDLSEGVRQAILLAIHEVNDMSARVGKVLPPEATNGSGTSSS